MKKRQFKTESKRILDLMINSIYTNKEIFLRELISNSSDALDKLYYLSLTNKDIKVNKDDLFIRVDYNKDKRTITISDNGTGMTEEELENNLGVIAESGSLKFKEENKEQNDVNIIGQFGVGFYSAFMVSDKVTVESKSYKDDRATIWESAGVDGYTLSPSDKKDNGTIITLHLKEDTEDYNYSELLSEYKLRGIIKKYSDYISYPIKMEVENNRKKEDSDEYEKGLQLYTNGVLIMDKCSELLPDYFSFVRGVIDTEDIPLNISRETLQDDKNIKLIAKSIESKVKNELLDLLKNNRDKYLEFYKAFGMQLKFGIYNDYGMHKDKLEDLIMFYSSGEKKLITLDEYVNKLKEEDKNIYYCAGETVDKIDMLPQVEGIKDKHEVLYLTDYVDEFAIMAIHEYKGKTFVNVTNESTDLSTDEEKEKINKENTDNKDMLEEMKKVLEGNVEEVKLTNKLKSHPVCLTTTGEVSTSMEKVINAMPTDEKIKANEVLEINASHKIVDKLKDLYKNNKDEFTKYTKVIYYEARLIEGLPIDNPTELSNLMCDIMANK